MFKIVFLFVECQCNQHWLYVYKGKSHICLDSVTSMVSGERNVFWQQKKATSCRNSKHRSGAQSFEAPSVPFKVLRHRQPKQKPVFISIRVARWYIFKPKIPIWINFGKSCNGSCWKFYGLLVIFPAIWCRYYMAHGYILW
jgi:hypothetical protein